MRVIGEAEQPLTAGQRARLLFDCVPFVASLAVLMLLLWLPPEMLGPRRVLVVGVAVAIALALLYRAVQRLRDLGAGTVRIAQDRLTRKFGGRKGKYYFGQFERLGRLRFVGGSHVEGIAGQRYRVFYSPASRLVWRLESA